MALQLVTFANKIDYENNPLPAENKVTAADLNEIKTKLNAVIDAVNNNLRKPIVRYLSASDFSGSFYASADLVGLTTNDFLLFTNDGAGTLLSGVATSAPGTPSFAFSATLGRITIASGDYLLIIFKPV